jgi:hypothetical protein
MQDLWYAEGVLFSKPGFEALREPWVHRFIVLYTESVASGNLKYDLAWDER